jgi:cytochrome c oxidase subunit III
MNDELLAPQFEDLRKQRDAAHLGMWAFLGSEALLFTGLFALYGTYRALYPEEFALAVTHNDATIGTTNTLVLLTSSFTVALAVHEVRIARPRRAIWLLLASIFLAFVFLALKMTEYAEHFRQGIYPGSNYRFAELTGYGAQAFFTIYFLATGLHALHVIAGSAVLGWLAFGVWRRALTAAYPTHVELGALYWHLVDIIWIFLWPCLYLLRK